MYIKIIGIVRRLDDLGHVIIPKLIHRTFRIGEGDLIYYLSLTPIDQFY